MGQYEEKGIAKEYGNDNRLDNPVRKMFYDQWTYLCQLMTGGLRDINVCDIGCGAGVSSRLLADLGAIVVGVERENKLLEIACRKEEENPQGINYFLGKLPFEMPGFEDDSFDLVTGAFLLHYAKSKDELKAMLREIYRILKPGGCFVGINHDPETPVVLTNDFFEKGIIPHKIRWGKCAAPWIEGSKIEAVIKGISKPIEAFWWKRETYQNAFIDSGLNPFSWQFFKFPDKQRPANWEDAEKNFCIRLMAGEKPG